MTFSPDFDILLIDLVKANPILWERQSRSSPYKELRTRDTELWKSIATSLKTDVLACTRRWNNLRQKVRRELAKEKDGEASDWTLMPKLRFLQQPSYNHRNSERQQTNNRQLQPPNNVGWSSQNGEQVHDEDDQLQEAMDEQQAAALPPAGIPSQTSEKANPSTVPFTTDVIKRIESLLEGLGPPNREKAEKRILTYLCKCNLRSLNNEEIDDILL
ncbi:transcription factor Adf-1 [Drosophila tropicalis]|uniref:transcription factor Adf-1 n=1 Tax=Drosophila tropicalis TaxID=46794 RepID=UPI0035AB6D2C